MPTATQRLIFFSLLALFILHSFFVYTHGTEEDKGREFRTESADRGKLLFQKHNCIACHQLYGLGGYMGPDLTNVISAQGKGAPYAKAFLMSGTQRMPNFHLNENEINDLLEYLTYIDKTGLSPVKKFTINIDGTVSQP